MSTNTSGANVKQAQLFWAGTALAAHARGRLEIDIHSLEYLRVFPVIKPIAGVTVSMELSSPQPETNPNLEIMPRLVLIVENTTDAAVTWAASEINLRGFGPAARPAGHTRASVTALANSPGPFAVTSGEGAGVTANWSALASSGDGGGGGGGGSSQVFQDYSGTPVGTAGDPLQFTDALLTSDSGTDTLEVVTVVADAAALAALDLTQYPPGHIFAFDANAADARSITTTGQSIATTDKYVDIESSGGVTLNLPDLTTFYALDKRGGEIEITASGAGAQKIQCAGTDALDVSNVDGGTVYFLMNDGDTAKLCGKYKGGVLKWHNKLAT